MVIAPGRFRDEEVRDVRAIFRQAGIGITIASTTTDPVMGMLGSIIVPDELLEHQVAHGYVAVVFIGGAGAAALFDDPDCHRLARETLDEDIVLGAICVAPCILARAGVLAGRKATVWKSAPCREALIRGGAEGSEEPLVVDGRLVTAMGPHQTPDFARIIVTLIKDQDPDPGFDPTLNKRLTIT